MSKIINSVVLALLVTFEASWSPSAALQRSKNLVGVMHQRRNAAVARVARDDAQPSAVKSILREGFLSMDGGNTGAPNVGSEPQSVGSPRSLNGWTPDETLFCWGLPGSVAPVKDFDPLGLANGRSLNEIKLFREAEVTHGRVAMMAFLGFLVPEAGFHPLFSFMAKLYHPEQGPVVLTGPAIRHLDEVRTVAPYGFELLVFGIAASEVRGVSANIRCRNGHKFIYSGRFLLECVNICFRRYQPHRYCCDFDIGSQKRRGMGRPG